MVRSFRGARRAKQAVKRKSDGDSKSVERKRDKSRSNSPLSNRSSRSRSRSKPRSSRQRSRSRSRSRSTRSRSKSRLSKKRSISPPQKKIDDRSRNEKNNDNDSSVGRQSRRRVVVDENNNQVKDLQPNTDNKPSNKEVEKVMVESPCDDKTKDTLEIFKQIYYQTERKLHNEAYFRLTKLVLNEKLEMSELKCNDLLEKFKIFNEKNVNLLDELLNDERNYHSKGALNIDKLNRGLENLKIFIGLPSVLKLTSGIKDALVSTKTNHQKKPTVTVKKEAMEHEDRAANVDEEKHKSDDDNEEDSVLKIDEQEDLNSTKEELDLKKHGYEHIKRDDCRIIRSTVKEDLKEPDENDCFGVALSRTRFGKSCYVGNLSGDYEPVEFELLSLFEKFGRVVEVKVTCLEKSGRNGGTGVVRFSKIQHAKEAIKNLNGHKIGNKTLRVEEFGQDLNNRLFINGGPISYSPNKWYRELRDHIKGIRTIDTGETKRTFIFIDFITSEHAKIAKEVLENKADRMFPNHRIVVAWAHSSRYNTLHVRNFSSQMTQEKLAELFEPYGEIVHIKMNKDHAYVLFKSVFDAALARDELNLKSIDSKELLVEPRDSYDFMSKAKRGMYENNGGDENVEPSRKMVRPTIGPHTPQEPEKTAFFRRTAPLQTVTNNYRSNQYGNGFNRHDRHDERPIRRFSLPRSTSSMGYQNQPFSRR